MRDVQPRAHGDNYAFYPWGYILSSLISRRQFSIGKALVLLLTGLLVLIISIPSANAQATGEVWKRTFESGEGNQGTPPIANSGWHSTTECGALNYVSPGVGYNAVVRNFGHNSSSSHRSGMEKIISNPCADSNRQFSQPGYAPNANQEFILRHNPTWDWNFRLPVLVTFWLYVDAPDWRSMTGNRFSQLTLKGSTPKQQIVTTHIGPEGTMDCGHCTMTFRSTQVKVPLKQWNLQSLYIENVGGQTRVNVWSDDRMAVKGITDGIQFDAVKHGHMGLYGDNNGVPNWNFSAMQPFQMFNDDIKFFEVANIQEAARKIGDELNRGPVETDGSGPGDVVQSGPVRFSCSGESANIFCDDFEDGNSTGWSGADLSGGTQTFTWSVKERALHEESGSGNSILLSPQQSILNTYTVKSYVRTPVSDGNDIAGIIFGHQDNRNYYVFEWIFASNDIRNPSVVGRKRQLVQVQNGTRTILQTESNVGFITNRWYEMKVEVTSSGVKTFIDGSQVLSSQAPAFGRLGVLSVDNDSGEDFDNFLISANIGLLYRDPNGGSNPLPVCPDGTCNGNETCLTCPQDCGQCSYTCPNGTCSGSETCSSCPQDCGQCSATNRPDYVVSQMTSTCSNGKFTIRATVLNQGTVAATVASTTHFYNDQNVMICEVNNNTPALGINSTAQITCDWTPGGSGQRTITAKADAKQTIQEISGFNNTNTLTLDVGNCSSGGGDTTPPTVSITSPTNGATVLGAVNVAATATDNVGVTRVDFMDGGNLIGTDTSSPYSVSWNTVSAGNGSHALTAIARDAANNQKTSNAVNVTVSNSPSQCEATVQANVAQRFRAVTTDPESQDITYTFNWGDNSPIDTVTGKNGVPVEAENTWTAAKTVTVKVSARDTDGNVAPLSSDGREEFTVCVNAAPGGSPCNNGQINTGEDCDGNNLGGQTCQSLGFSGGTLSCNQSTCKFNTSQCTNPPPPPIGDRYNPPYPRSTALALSDAVAALGPSGLAKFDLVLARVPSSEPTYAEQIKQRNPNTLVFGITDWNNGFGVGRNLVDQWKTYRSDGTAVGLYNNLAFTANMTDFAPRISTQFGTLRFNEYVPPAALNKHPQCNGSNGPNCYDGIATDGIWMIPREAEFNDKAAACQDQGDIDLNRNNMNDYCEFDQSWVNLQWRTGATKIINEVNRLSHDAKFPSGRPLILNSGRLHAENGRDTGYNYTNHNGLILENFNESQLRPFKSWYIGAYRNWMSKARQPHLLMFIGARNGWSGDYQLVRFLLGATLFGDGFFGFASDVLHHTAHYFDELDQNLGYPKSDMQEVRSTGAETGVWVRFFDKGMVIFTNDPSGQTVTVADVQGKSGYAGPYKRFLGSQDSSVNNGRPFDTANPVVLKGRAATKGPIGDAIILIK